MPRLLLVGLAALAGAIGGLLLLAAPLFRVLDARLNSSRARADAAHAVSPAAEQLHRHLWIADLHSDATLWSRGLLERSPRGHVDLPRLRAGNVALQVLSFPNAYPLPANYRRTPAVFDLLGLAALANNWPRSTWRSPAARVLYQTRVVYDAAHDSRGGLVVVTSAADLAALYRADFGAAAPVGAVLAVEGLHVPRGDLRSLDAMFRAGIRVFGLAHMSDNAVAGSAHGWRKHGLTEFGARAVARLDSLGAIFDLAHASNATIDDVLAMASRPVLVSHTGLDGTCPGPRNLSDEQARRVAGQGGIIGVGFWEGAVCGHDAAAIARAMRYLARLVGIDAVALGSDFDGAVRTPFDAGGLVLLTDALLAEGFDEHEIARIMGLNVQEFFMRALPPEG